MFAYLSYWLRMVRCVLVGSRVYYAWMGSLLVVLTVGLIAYARQTMTGLVVTAMTDQVSWGIYNANFVFFVGIAAAAVLLVVPSYVYHRKDIKEVVLIGELLAVTAGVTCLLFIMSDLGHPERAWHLMPGAGFLNLPRSLLAWDVVVFSGYLLLNLHIPGYVLYKTYRGETPRPIFYIPLVFISMFWAVSIHTVTAFLLSGLASRPFWNSAILAPRFLISAGASGPALLTLIFTVVRNRTPLKVKDSVFNYLQYVLRITMPINLFLLACDVFTEFYPGALHSINARYLYFGLGEHHMLPKFIWSAITFDVLATVIFVSRLRTDKRFLYTGCALTLLGIWIEKGMGLLFTGFTPSPLGEVVEYAPNAAEIFVCLGVLSLGALIFTAMAKVAIAIQTGELRLRPGPAVTASEAHDAAGEAPGAAH
jgi:molybdopterin-containing oxidoreductase family membrane subunit